jgi:hypothetical protein
VRSRKKSGDASSGHRCVTCWEYLTVDDMKICVPCGFAEKHHGCATVEELKRYYPQEFREV